MIKHSIIIVLSLLFVAIVIGCTSPSETPTTIPTVSTGDVANIHTRAVSTDDSTPITKITPVSLTETNVPTPTTILTPTPTLSATTIIVETVATTPEQPQGDNNQLYVPLEYVSLVGLGTGTYLMEVAWEPDGRFLTYALWSDKKSREPSGWDWWQYDLVNGQKQQLESPESLVSEEARQQLNLCPIDETKWENDISCWRFSSLYESPYSDHIVFQPIPEETGEFSNGELWIAHQDGSDVQKLADFTPSYVHWSSDGQWFLTGNHFPGLPGQETHYLAKTDSSFIERLNQLSGTDHFLINGLFPEFSPDGSKVAYLGSTIFESFNEDDYQMYVLNLETLESQLVSDRVGFFQWADDSQGIYIFDNGHYPIDPNEQAGLREGNLYFINLHDLSNENLIVTDLPYYPRNSVGTWLWAFSSETKAIAYIGFQDSEELGIIRLALQKPE